MKDPQREPSLKREGFFGFWITGPERVLTLAGLLISEKGDV